VANKPDYVVRAKTGRRDNEGKDIFFTVGAAWSFPHSEGFSIKVQSLPVGFDGTLLVSPAKDDD
jgi:hypothetical protein